MGIYDREYYRREGPSFLETISRWGVVCKWLIILNACAYVIQLLTDQPGTGGPFTSLLALNVDAVLHGQVWRLVTYGFLHNTGSVWHILFNMLFLWWFGTQVEGVYGPKEFLAFYLTAILAGGLGIVGEAVLRGELVRAVGASAAVTAVLLLCACHFPRQVVNLFMILPVRIWVFVIFQVAQDVFGLLGAGGLGNTAFSGHLGGALFAYAYYKWEGRLLALLPDFRSWWQRRRQPALKLYREEEEVPQPVPAGGTIEVDEQFEAKVDAALEKVQRFGQNSLTEGEREILMKASERARRRRRS